ncbi:MAG: hypothetical protein ABSB70_24980 [Candidatus Velthaea sp.]
MTTARCEPILRAALGSSHIDLLFEQAAQSAVLSGLRLDANQLITRERSAFVWPVFAVQSVEADQLEEIERRLTPWLRSISRARGMSAEAVRRFIPSERFEQARLAGLFGAAPLEQTLPRMAPFVYARRFAAGARVWIDCADGPLAQAVLADLAAVIERPEPRNTEESFAALWYGSVPAAATCGAGAELAIVDACAKVDAPITILLKPAEAAAAVRWVDVPSPAPWDLLFSFDVADAPAVSRFGVLALEPQLREPRTPPVARAVGGSAGTIVLAVSPEALAMRGPDIEEAQILSRRLAAEGFTVEFCSDAGDAALDRAQLVHIFGAPFEDHASAFAESAQKRGTPYVFDVPPCPNTPSGLREADFGLICRAVVDDAMVSSYETAYFAGRLDSGGAKSEASAEEFARKEARFAQLARYAAAVIVMAEDRELMCAALPPSIASRVLARGIFADAEPVAEAIGHLVPRAPFAFVHATIAARSHALLTAVAAERGNLPCVIAGPVYDVEYLQTIRIAAPSAIVLADAAPGIMSALYRRAAVWVDASSRPRSAAALTRAVDCGALPLLTANSPLLRIAGEAGLTFPATSIDDCTRAIASALVCPDREQRLAELQDRLLPRRAEALGSVLSAYLRSAVAVSV